MPRSTASEPLKNAAHTQEQGPGYSTTCSRDREEGAIAQPFRKSGSNFEAKKEPGCQRLDVKQERHERPGNDGKFRDRSLMGRSPKLSGNQKCGQNKDNYETMNVHGSM